MKTHQVVQRGNQAVAGIFAAAIVLAVQQQPAIAQFPDVIAGSPDAVQVLGQSTVSSVPPLQAGQRIIRPTLATPQDCAPYTYSPQKA